jgi:hypothetical protein
MTLDVDSRMGSDNTTPEGAVSATVDVVRQPNRDHFMVLVEGFRGSIEKALKIKLEERRAEILATGLTEDEFLRNGITAVSDRLHNLMDLSIPSGVIDPLAILDTTEDWIAETIEQAAHIAPELQSVPETERFALIKQLFGLFARTGKMAIGTVKQHAKDAVTGVLS